MAYVHKPFFFHMVMSHFHSMISHFRKRYLFWKNYRNRQVAVAAKLAAERRTETLAAATCGAQASAYRCCSWPTFSKATPTSFDFPCFYPVAKLDPPDRGSNPGYIFCRCNSLYHAFIKMSKKYAKSSFLERDWSWGREKCCNSTAWKSFKKS